MKTYLKYLYPETEPFHKGFYAAPDSNHKIYYEVSGNPNGVAIVYVHGGPGGGTSPVCRRYFDPKFYKIILIDQRGCGLSTPSISTVNNTTDFLVEDMENIRKLLGIEQWILFGGSWGTTLSLCYAIKYPQNVSKMVLRGIYLNRESDIKWLFQEGASYFKPREFDQYTHFLTAQEKNNIVDAYYYRMNSDNEKIRNQAFIEWSRWETCLISVNEIAFDGENNLKETKEISFLENYYFFNKGFMPENYILNNVERIKDIETYIVHGVYDLDCRPSGAYELAKELNNAHLFILSKTAHTQREWKISKKLVEITKSFIR
ncbi:prolyl aminopeptidase [Mycoplasma sp. ES3157-GEN-MYC]|uniref:Proline iminopeptidase n=1 Tax=Mycoplasma miroungigenitalium TaxID=754515 RepID=A0A6M4JA09_9MOLU|nr:prolyl aminopeptidase [Mycoplasma miroungigenitalium]MBU4690659.1 prolyl aminopeptidase [Mycoplasma miroungigenitalium]MBU4691927.1 prolyl aminopeptidase [Mycoplasma miroungigenitalium]QJR43783.1 prolyl aminopeptidase [Mycoplasma miroungigenitalium]